MLLPDWHEGLAEYLAERAGTEDGRVKMLVTGGAGFIGSTSRATCSTPHPEDEVVVLDKLTYAGRVETIEDLLAGGRCTFVNADITDQERVREALEGCDAIVNFAAESHVDRSIEEPGHFIQTDVYGTYVLLEEARSAGIERYLQVSTDEVYGSIEDGTFTEHSPLGSFVAVLGIQGGRRPDRVRVLPHVRDERDGMPRLEQLRPLSISREADPAVRAERDARRSASRVRGRDAGAQLALRDRPLPRDRRRAALRPCG